MNIAAQNVTKIASAIKGGWWFSIDNTYYSENEVRKYYVRDFSKAIGFSEESVRTAYIELNTGSSIIPYFKQQYANAKEGEFGYEYYSVALAKFQNDTQSTDKIFALINQVLKNEGLLELTETNINSAYEAVKKVSKKSAHYNDISTYYAEISTCYKNCQNPSGSYVDFSNMVQNYSENISKLDAKLSVSYKK